MAERLAQAVGVALVTVHLEIIMRRHGGTMLADYQRGRGYTPGRPLFCTENVNRACTVADNSAKGSHRVIDRFAHRAGVGWQVNRVQFACQTQELMMVARTRFTNQEGRLHRVHPGDSST